LFTDILLCLLLDWMCVGNNLILHHTGLLYDAYGFIIIYHAFMQIVVQNVTNRSDNPYPFYIHVKQVLTAYFAIYFCRCHICLGNFLLSTCVLYDLFTQRVPLVEEEVLTLPEYLISLPVFIGLVLLNLYFSV
jgi:hypothetical protein